MQSELKPADVWLLNYASRCVTAVEQATTASTTTKAKLVANILRQLVDEKDAIIDALCMENSEYCEALHTHPTASNLPADSNLQKTQIAPDVVEEVREALANLISVAEHNIYPQPDKVNSDYAKLVSAKSALAKLSALSRNEPAPDVVEADYSAWQQKRGMMADAIDAILLDFDEFMKDDNYDAWAKLHQYIDRLRELQALAKLSAMPSERRSFQDRVSEWMQTCFGPQISADRLERRDRFLEEALELVQTLPEFTADRAHALVDYVFNRPTGRTEQEVGGVSVTLAALCEAEWIDQQHWAEVELARINAPDVIEKIRAKQAGKPTGSALPTPPEGEQP